MANFLDQMGTKWEILFDALVLRKLRTSQKVDLTKEGGKDFDDLSEDPEKLLDVLWHLCESQADEKQISPEQFARRMVGEAIDRAVDCLRAAVNDFLPPSRREVFNSIANENAALRAEQRGWQLAKIADPALRKRVLAAMDEEADREIQRRLIQLQSASNGPEPLVSAPPD